MNGSNLLWLSVILLSIGIFIYFEFPWNDAGVVYIDEKYTVSIPSQLEAQNSISTDTIDNFFEKISTVDMTLQMKIDSPKININPTKEAYKSFLKNQTLKFKSAEVRGLKRICKEVFVTLESKAKINLVRDIQIVKLTENIYGKNVFFTRNKTIFLTEQFFSLNFEARKKIFAHELSHVFSRNYYDYKPVLYPTIGFKNLKAQYYVFSSDELNNSFGDLLWNPDGSNADWYFNFKNINLHINADSAEFFPVLFYEKSKTLNASYLQNYTFGFIEFEKWNEKIKVSTVNGKRVDDYNNYFKENYGITYTIHPDEIIAELFTEWLLDDKMVMEADGLESKTFEAFTEIFNTRYQ